MGLQFYVELATDSNDERVLTLGRDIAMQVAAMNPKYILDLRHL